MISESTIYAVDDDEVTLSVLETIFVNANLNVETYGSAEEFLEAYSPMNPGCLLLDIGLPGMNGFELQERLVSMGDHAPIIFLSGTVDVPMAARAFKSGAVDVIEKPIKVDQLRECVDKALKLDIENRYKLLQQAQIEKRLTQLTPREKEVMKWILRGKTNKLIAEILDISVRTVEVHRSNVLEKMRADSVAELVTTVLKLEGDVDLKIAQ